MEKKVQKISLTSDPEAVYFIQIAWKKDLGNGFNVTVCNGHSAWIGEVSKEDITKEANDMEMDRRKYVDELKKALILTIPPSAKYSFDLMKDGDSSETFSFTYEKKLKDLSYKLGSLKLAKSQNPADIIRDLIDYCLNRTMELYNQNDHLQKENERLQSDWKDMHEQLQKCVSSKEELEQDLYTKFTYVLNEKKGKIRSLKEKLDLAQQRVQQTCDNSAFDTVPVSQIKDDDYGGTTEEETESQEATTAPATSSKRRSLISSPDDSPDIAPSRKRRQRGQKSYYTEVKAKNPRPEIKEKQRCNTALSKVTSKNSSSERASSQTSKSTPDPDDLFSDI
ncbi:DNA repair protein XRCC4 isoform X1 [Spea bombifrons]|uniref:DNA repair protein XRCC4 isoform X1 n=1 Tax=Spea bombifrons TaxID=233779 RepID=UPI00234B3B93|nr:DNA repair protein XRCC4 isoform X1 [Spea bombifrons]XP_053331182.1 DNA repair protein XRCC4 isoform X1 [Spea bombifrons]